MGKSKKSKTIKSPKYGDKFTSTSSLKQGEYLRFRNSKGKLTKFDGRKNLLAEIWKNGKKTDVYYQNVINKKTGQPKPKKYDSKKIANVQKVIKYAHKPITEKTDIRELAIKVDARFSIMDNILAKADIMLSDIVKFSKKNNAGIVTTEMEYGKNNSSRFDVFRSVHKSQNKSDIALDIARMVISRLYSDKLRMSNIQVSPLGRRGEYVRSIKLFFSWYEAKL